MKLIGVTGKSGAGKTTFSDMLANKSNIGVIHVDDILLQIKLKYFKIFMNKSKDGTRTKVNSKLKMLIYKNKRLFDLFMKFRAKLIEKPIESEIERFRNEGKKAVIIDDTFIKYQRRYEELSKIYIIERPYIERKEAIIKRDKSTKEDVVAADTAHYKRNYKEISKRRNIEKIQNNGTKEDLQIVVNQIYEKEYITFKDKYKQKDIIDTQKDRIPEGRRITKNNEKEIID